MLEAVHKNPNYLYSKQIYYIDPECWYIIYADKYDKKGRLWKIFEFYGSVEKNVYNGESCYYGTHMHIIDVQRMHATGVPTKVILGEIDKIHQPAYYNPSALMEYGY